MKWPSSFIILLTTQRFSKTTTPKKIASNPSKTRLLLNHNVWDGTHFVISNNNNWGNRLCCLKTTSAVWRQGVNFWIYFSSLRIAGSLRQLFVCWFVNWLDSIKSARPHRHLTNPQSPPRPLLLLAKIV